MVSLSYIDYLASKLCYNEEAIRALEGLYRFNQRCTKEYYEQNL